ncbi:hypothetical protein [Bordetella hinzii]|uniref:hypothetical protein n=1 Tax=Bordetella hinzii TaxID=103855 RepID=UPI00115029D6|nr:hypothetical protein [Bordetella hinzii]QDJ52823.1 hypothetical protein CBR69_22130 [Bordetella hinzii]
MATFLTEIRPYFELVYFLTGGPVLAVLAGLALKQITVAKANARIAAQREAYRLAAEQVKVWLGEIVPLSNSLNQACKERGLDFDSLGEIIETDKEIQLRLKAGWADTVMNPDNREAVEAFLALVNRLETFSVFFTSKIAAERMAFDSIGHGFVRYVTPLVPMLFIVGGDGHWGCTKKLWFLWYRRQKESALKLEAKRIEAALKASKSDEIIPLGAK